MESQSNMRNLPDDQNTGDDPVVVKGKLYASTKSQQDQLAEFAATLGSPVPLEHRPENKGHAVPATPVEATAEVVTIEHPVESAAVVDVVLKVDGQELGSLNHVGGFALDVVPPTQTDEEGPSSGFGEACLEKHLAQSTDPSMDQPPEIVGDAAPVPGIKSVATEGFSGFEVPDGDYMVMMLLHPERDSNGKVLEVPQIQVGTTREAWTSWVKAAMKHGLTHGSVSDEDGVTELTGFSIMVKPPVGAGEPKRLGFMFKQIAAIIPFRDVDDLMLRREAENEARRKAAQKKHKAKASKRKEQSKSRRKNR